jgi:hypothetical protein
LLAAQARALRAAGLTRLTVSLDALDPALFLEFMAYRSCWSLQSRGSCNAGHSVCWISTPPGRGSRQATTSN